MNINFGKNTHKQTHSDSSPAWLLNPSPHPGCLLVKEVIYTFTTEDQGKVSLIGFDYKTTFIDADKLPCEPQLWAGLGDLRK